MWATPAQVAKELRREIRGSLLSLALGTIRTCVDHARFAGSILRRSSEHESQLARHR